MRLIAEQLLPNAMRGTTFVRNELSRQQPRPARLPADGRHYYCSPNNTGASNLMRELEGELQIAPTWTTAAHELAQCNYFLILLNARTWTCNDATSLAAEVERAMELGVPLLLCHEMPSAMPEGTTERHAVDFSSFFSHTPQVLLGRGIYSTIAIPLKPGAWRTVGLVMVAQAASVPSARASECLHAITQHVARANTCKDAVSRVWNELCLYGSTSLVPPWRRRAQLADADGKLELELHCARHTALEDENATRPPSYSHI